eukprot:5598503-Pleurochrysis_carterae.AAC.1
MHKRTHTYRPFVQAIRQALSNKGGGCMQMLVLVAGLLLAFTACRGQRQHLWHVEASVSLPEEALTRGARLECSLRAGCTRTRVAHA